jgi:Ca2+-binding RTX toxin-like protein
VDTVRSTAPDYTLTANVERGVIATNNAANLTGNGLDNIMTAGGGDNVIDGQGGIDQVSYATATAGVSVDLTISGAQATGGSGSDTLISIENLTGSAFHDELAGNANANVLSGGAGGDFFVFDNSSGADKIRDFSVSDGDVIELRMNINGSGIVNGASALAHVHDAGANAVLDLGGGNSVLLVGVHTADLSAASFSIYSAT